MQTQPSKKGRNILQRALPREYAHHGVHSLTREGVRCGITNLLTLGDAELLSDKKYTHSRKHKHEPKVHPGSFHGSLFESRFAYACQCAVWERRVRPIRLSHGFSNPLKPPRFRLARNLIDSVEQIIKIDRIHPNRATFVLASRAHIFFY